jgi:hypothetical protein
VPKKAAGSPFSLGEKVDAPKARPDEGSLEVIGSAANTLTPNPSPRGRGECVHV